MNDEESGADAGTKPRRGVWVAVVCGFILLLVLLALAQRPAFLELVGHFLLGWIAYAQALFPLQLPGHGAVMVPALCGIVVVVLAHRLALTWLAPGSRWRFAHTLVLAGLLILASAAMLAVSGMARSAADLAQYPWIHNRGRSMAMSTAYDYTRRLLGEIEDFENKEGRFPESLEELEERRPRTKQWTWMTLRHGSPKERFHYLKPVAEPFSADEQQPMIMSPRIWGNCVVVGFAEGNWRKVWEDELEEMLHAARTHGSGPSTP
jgi:hypothetical protein